MADTNAKQLRTRGKNHAPDGMYQATGGRVETKPTSELLFGPHSGPATKRQATHQIPARWSPKPTNPNPTRERGTTLCVRKVPPTFRIPEVSARDPPARCDGMRR
ncbi:MAG: hypothetical protein ACF8AM_22540, partial [Rhodopirellula sp. JB055]|uniref:hypothetical protein n=1 Tax=Rhodopirellula sp. JB055 TaxID=3342846 RepID=UPI00370B1291